MSKQILIVTASDPLMRILAEQCGRHGFKTAEAASVPESMAIVTAGAIDVMLLDVALAADILPLFRSRHLAEAGHMPVVAICSAQDDPASWQERGADACVTKPVKIVPLLALLDRLTRAPAPERLTIGAFMFDSTSRSIEDGEGNRIALTEKEVAVIAYLAQAGRRAVPREELLAEVWGYADGATTHTVETHVYRLRRKLSGMSAAFLTTADGGYRLEDG